jgi:hypothetical protein
VEPGPVNYVGGVSKNTKYGLNQSARRAAYIRKIYNFCDFFLIFFFTRSLIGSLKRLSRLMAQTTRSVVGEEMAFGV